MQGLVLATLALSLTTVNRQTSIRFPNKNILRQKKGTPVRPPNLPHGSCRREETQVERVEPRILHAHNTMKFIFPTPPR